MRLISRKGQTLVEYGLILVIIAVVAVFAIGPLKTLIQSLFNTAQNTVTNAATSAAGG